MKKLYFFTVLLLSVQIGQAQFSIDAFNTPKIGDKHSLAQADTTGVQPGSAGNGITWDFSNLTPNGDSSYYEVIAPSATDYAAQFPNATTAQVDLYGNYSYFEIANNAYNYYGSVSDDGQGGQLVYAYTDPAKYFDFPMAFQSTSTDALAAGYTTGGLDFDRTGTITTTYDGFGTVITPEGTFNNVARLKIVEDNDDVATVSGFPVNIDTDITTYMWLEEGKNQPVMHMSFVKVVTSGVITNSKIVSYRKGSGTVGIATLDSDKVLVYPNPVNQNLNLQLPNNATNIQLLDVTGKASKINLVNGASNDVSRLSAGIYTLHYSQGNILSTIQVVKH